MQYRNVAGRVLQKAIRQAGLAAFTFHDLRRTHATMLVDAGISPKVIQERLGHQTLELTLRLYAQPTQESRDRAARVAVRYLVGDLSEEANHITQGN